ncbi:MAG: hypothetical protein ACYDGM_12530 [Vulcanimicrobiaceae bacterium]
MSAPLGEVESTQSEPSGAAATCVAEPGICAQLADAALAIGMLGDRIALAGRIAVLAIGAGAISAGETDLGIASDIGGAKRDICDTLCVGSSPCERPEHPAASSTPTSATKKRLDLRLLDNPFTTEASDRFGAGSP